MFALAWKMAWHIRLPDQLCNKYLLKHSFFSMAARSITCSVKVMLEVLRIHVFCLVGSICTGMPQGNSCRTYAYAASVLRAVDFLRPIFLSCASDSNCSTERCQSVHSIRSKAKARTQWPASKAASCHCSPGVAKHGLCRMLREIRPDEPAMLGGQVI